MKKIVVALLAVAALASCSGGRSREDDMRKQLTDAGFNVTDINYWQYEDAAKAVCTSTPLAMRLTAEKVNEREAELMRISVRVWCPSRFIEVEEAL